MATPCSGAISSAAPLSPFNRTSHFTPFKPKPLSWVFPATPQAAIKQRRPASARSSLGSSYKVPSGSSTEVLERIRGAEDGLSSLAVAPRGEAGLLRVREAEESSKSGDVLWLEMRREARRDAEEEPALASYLFSTVLAHRNLEAALAAHLSNKLASPTLLSTQLAALCRQVLLSSPRVGEAVRRDIRAARERDPACVSLLHCFLNFKGFQALQAHRVAHELWQQGRHALALALQSRSAEVFHVDIHPAATIGSGVLLDHGTGIVIGETAVVGNDVSLLHNVTLGGTGVLGSRRHPRIEDGVVLGTGARVLGPVVVAAGAKVGAGSVVVKDVAPGSTVVGNPAREAKGKRLPGGTFVPEYMI